MDVSGEVYTLDAPFTFLEIPTITLKYTRNGDDDRSAPFTGSPLDEYRGTGSISLRRIRTLGAAHDPTYAAERARSILVEARAAIERILGKDRGGTLSAKITELLRSI
jgi:hypothetical protein